MRNSILVKAELNPYTLRLRLIQRWGKTQCFTLCRELFADWVNGVHSTPYTEKDGTDVATAYCHGGGLDVYFQFANWAGNGLYRLVERNIRLSLAAIRELLSHSEGERSFLSHDEPTPQAELVWHADHDYMQAILSDKRKRNALRKALRDRFKWRNSIVHLYPDGNNSFYFQEENGINGGLILHQLRDGRYEYSVHT